MILSLFFRQIKIREKIESLTEHYKFHEEVRKREMSFLWWTQTPSLCVCLSVCTQMMKSKLKSGEEEKREIMRKTMERK